MDPLVAFATRNSATFPVLTYDGRYLYERDSYTPTFSLSTDSNPNVHVAPELLTMLEEEKSSFFVPEREKIVFERANPFIKIPGLVKDAEMKAFQLLFNFRGSKIVINHTRSHMRHVLNEGILIERPFNNLLVSLPMSVNNAWMHFVYLLTKIYKRVTLLQLAMSDVRYLIAMEYTGIPPGWDAELRNLSTHTDARELTSIFQVVPACFSAWFTFMNNVHIAKVIEILLLTRGQKDAFDGKGIFTSMPSYDFKRVVNLLNGQPTIQEGIKSSSFKFLKEPDEEFVRGLHLYGEPENFSEIPIHTQINFETDITMSYSKGHKVTKGGIHWGQRKLLLSEIDFFTHFLKRGEKAVAYYIGAAPFDHGRILLEMFPDLTFVLCDPRDVWSDELRQEANRSHPRVIIECGWVDEEHIKNLISEVATEGRGTFKVETIRKATKVFFVSDIRSTSTLEVGTIDNEVKVHDDMLLQQKLAQQFGDAMTAIGKQFAASFKFRMPFFDEIGGSDYSYLGGILKTQPWSRPKSTELRLWWTPEDGQITYNKKKLEDIMMYHNSVLRDATFGSTGMVGYCECHDCHYEIQIMSSYIAKFVPPTGLQLEDSLKGYVSLFNNVLGKTLADHAESNRKKVKGFIVQKDLATSRLRYNPLVETMRSDLAFEHRAECVKTMKSAPEFEKVEEEVLNQIFGMSLLCGYYETGTYVGDIKEDIVMELCGVQMTPATIAKLKSQVGVAERKRLEALQSVRPEATVGVFAANLGAAKSYYKVTTKGEKPVSTMGFHKDVLRRFLQGNERKYDMTPSEIRRENVVLCKVYAILKRLGPAWHDHLAYSLDEFWEMHVDLPGFHNGGCILSARQGKEFQFSDNYGALIPELELGLTEHLNILQLKHLIIDAKVITIFAPPIRYLWTLFFNKAVEILDKYSDGNKAVVMVLPLKYISKLPEALSAFEHVPSRSQFAFKAFDTMKNKNVTLEDHVVRVFRTPNSDFELSN
jgi:hypothetical protein